MYRQVQVFSAPQVIYDIQHNRYCVEEDSNHWKESRAYIQSSHNQTKAHQNEAMRMHKAGNGVIMMHIGSLLGPTHVDCRQQTHNKEDRTKVDAKDEPRL